MANFKEFSKAMSNRLWIASQLYSERRGSTLAAGSSFYVILTIVPFLLLVVRLVGWMIGDVATVHSLVFKLGREVFPDVAPEILIKVNELIKHTLFSGAHFTLFNFVILTVSSLSFFNSIWSGLYLITGDTTFVKVWKHFKGVVIIGITIILILIAFSIQPVLFFGFNLMKHNMVIQFLWDHIETLRPMISFFRDLDLKAMFLFSSNGLYFFLFWLYFVVIYRWFFSWKLALKDGLLSAGVFVFLLLLGKNLFWIYILNVRSALMQNYGDFYTIIVGLIWIYMVMSFFFYSICLGHILMNNPLFKSLQARND